MATAKTRNTPMPGMSVNDMTASPPTVLINNGWQHGWEGIALVNTSTGYAANQQIGMIALPAIAAGAVGTVTLTNTLILATSTIFAWVLNQPAAGGAADTTAAARVTVAVRQPTAGNVVIEYKTDALMSQAWTAGVFIINGI